MKVFGPGQVGLSTKALTRTYWLRGRGTSVEAYLNVSVNVVLGMHLVTDHGSRI